MVLSRLDIALKYKGFTLLMIVKIVSLLLEEKKNLKTLIKQ